MSLDVTLQTDPGAISDDPVQEARRQIEICNACRYCEGYCSVFPAITRNKVFASGDITQLANLCHNCRGCYHACQYTAPHEFDLNLPKALGAARVDSWERFAWPSGLARLLQSHAAGLVVAIVLGMVITIAVQSSSITTSVLVPLAASGVLTLENIYPVTLGANVGTTVTALLASLATGNPAAVTVAVVHTLFNLSGILIFYPIRALRNLPLRLATGLSDLAAERRSTAIAYAFGMFVVIPLFGVILLR